MKVKDSVVADCQPSATEDGVIVSLTLLVTSPLSIELSDSVLD